MSGQAFAVRPSLLDLGSLRVFFEILQNCSTTVYEIFFTKRYRPSVVFFVVRFSKIISEKSSDLSKLIRNPFRTSLYTCFLLRKEVIHPHVPVGIPCYDLTPVIRPTFDGSLLAVMPPASGITDSHGLTGGVYKARERIHRDMLIRDY